MSRNRPTEKTVMVLGAVMVCLLLAGTVDATPIKPDVRKLVQQPQTPPPPYEPARAGWNGPETSAGQVAMATAQEAHVRAVRRALTTVITPDPRAWAAILAMILLLRALRTRREAKAVPAAAAGGREWQMPRAA